MRIETFIDIIGAEFYTGVPDSQIRALCDYLWDTYSDKPNHHIIAANEGNAVAIAAGYHLATGKIPVIYMQNSGEGNAINPLASLMNDNVYAVPAIFIIGWRGEPGVQDEPQHVYQGKVTGPLFDIMGVEHRVVSPKTTPDEVNVIMERFRNLLSVGKQAAFMIRKGAFSYERETVYSNDNTLTREEVIEHIVGVSAGDSVISTTGKTSRELFEVRERNHSPHNADFLTVGSMGHCSSIALGVALNTDKTVWCIDGDGAALMHLGALPVIASAHVHNLIHIVINNEAHESVGSQPTALKNMNISDIARACGYPYTVCVDESHSLHRELRAAKERKALTLIEVKCKIGSRENLGRPTSTPGENKKMFMEKLLLGK